MNSIYKYYRKLNIPSGSLRISITDDCNMRCNYCHNEGQPACSITNYMSIEDIRCIISHAKNYGLSKIRLTGGEPLLHPHINEIIAMIYQDLNIHNIGINTNGILLLRIKDSLDKGYLQQVVIGMDYFDGFVSKFSPVGLPSKDIKNNILLYLKKYSASIFFIDYVFHQDIDDLLNMISWCLDNNLSIRVLEKIDYYQQNYSKEEFDRLYFIVKSKFDLYEGIVVDLNERYLFNNNSTTISFYPSHCNREECDLCKNIHLRITADGYAKPCFFNNNGLFPLLNDDFYNNMNRAIINLGISPRKNLL